MEGFRSGAVFPRGKTQVVWMAKDAAANSIVCGFTVYVDDTPPTIKCPSSFPTKDSVMSFPQPEILDNLDSHPQLMVSVAAARDLQTCQYLKTLLMSCSKQRALHVEAV